MPRVRKMIREEIDRGMKDVMLEVIRSQGSTQVIEATPAQPASIQNAKETIAQRQNNSRQRARKIIERNGKSNDPLLDMIINAEDPQEMQHIKLQEQMEQPMVSSKEIEKGDVTMPENIDFNDRLEKVGDCLMFDDIKKMLLDSLVETAKLAPAEITGRVYPEVLVTDMAPEGLKAAAGPDRLAYLVGTEPLQIEIPNVRGIYEVNPCDIIFEAAGGYEKAFRAAMKKFGISTLSDLDTPAEKKGFYDFVDRVWHSKAEKEKGEEKGSHKDEGEFTDGLRDKHARDKDKMRDEKERAREKDQQAAEQDREQKKRETNEELPLYSDHQKAHKSEDKDYKE